jgi:hypothetical protein
VVTDIEVVRGHPDDEELAAVVVVLAARARPEREGDAPRRRPSLWAARAGQIRPAMVPGPGAWRASGLPG